MLIDMFIKYSLFQILHMYNQIVYKYQQLHLFLSNPTILFVCLNAIAGASSTTFNSDNRYACLFPEDRKTINKILNQLKKLNHYL